MTNDEEEFLVTDKKVIYALNKIGGIDKSLNDLMPKLHDLSRIKESYLNVVDKYLQSTVMPKEGSLYTILNTKEGYIVSKQSYDVIQEEVHSCQFCEMYIGRIRTLRLNDCEECHDGVLGHHHHILDPAIENMIVDRKEFKGWLKKKKQSDS